MRLPLALLPFLAPFLGSCATSGTHTNKLSPADSARYESFRQRPDYTATLDIFEEPRLLNRQHTAAKLEVDISDQRVRLLKHGSVALDAPCSTGKSGKRTPLGTFCIKEKLEDKRSNIFGKIIRNGRLIATGDCRGSKGRGTFVGASLPYWMRLTDDGIGLHASPTIARYPRSNGCVRLPKTAVATIFHNVCEGTPVAIIP